MRDALLGELAQSPRLSGPAPPQNMGSATKLPEVPVELPPPSPSEIPPSPLPAPAPPALLPSSSDSELPLPAEHAAAAINPNEHNPRQSHLGATKPPLVIGALLRKEHPQALPKPADRLSPQFPTSKRRTRSWRGASVRTDVR